MPSVTRRLFYVVGEGLTVTIFVVIFEEMQARFKLINGQTVENSVSGFHNA